MVHKMLTAYFQIRRNITKICLLKGGSLLEKITLYLVQDQKELSKILDIQKRHLKIYI